uniref:FLZ-type domain-containing protein n=1 Tax=Peronospora matthiolae TaxID=2874970 RepID=A0AAV1V8R1_9STRA
MPSSSIHVVTSAARIREDYHPKLMRRESVMHQTQEAVTTSTSFKSRMIQFIFHRRRRAPNQQPKSWSGKVECILRSAHGTASCPSSNDIEHHNEPGRCVSSAPPTSGQTKVKRIARRGYAEGDSGRAQWRQRQTHCANCECLFFTSLSSLSNAAGRFCSLDCRTNLEYMYQLQKLMDTQQTWEGSTNSSESGHNGEAEETTLKGVDSSTGMSSRTIDSQVDIAGSQDTVVNTRLDA